MAAMSLEISEDRFQAELFQWAWNELPETRRHIWAVPNGGWMENKAYAMKMRATGVVSGVWDLHFFWKGKLYLFELKVGNNLLSSLQRTWGAMMLNHGAECYEIHEKHSGRELFKKIITDIVRGSGGL